MNHQYETYDEFVVALETRPPEWSPLFWLSQQGPQPHGGEWMLRWLRESRDA